mgnify:FL=1
MLTVTGEKFAKEYVTSAFTGMWLSSAILLPIGIYLTYKATHDTVIFNVETYIDMMKGFGKIFIRRR